MAKIHYIVEFHPDYVQGYFFNNKRKAIEKGMEEVEGFEFGNEIENEETDAFFHSGVLNSNSGFLFWMEDGDWDIEEMDSDVAKGKIESGEIEENSAGAYFPAKLKTGYGECYIGSATEHTNGLWSFEYGDIYEKKQKQTTMKYLPRFESFVNERLNEAAEGVETRIVKFNIEVNEDFGTIEDQVTLAMGPDSAGLFSIGDDIEKFTGLKLADAEAYDEKPTDAFIYGMNNMMNGGGDMYLWFTGNRLAGDVADTGSWTALFDVFPHECIHLTKKLIVRQHAKNLGLKIDGEEWIKHDYGQGEYVWPGEGDHEDPMVIVNEEDFAWTHGFVCKTLAPHFLELAKSYVPELKSIDI